MAIGCNILYLSLFVEFRYPNPGIQIYRNKVSSFFNPFVRIFFLRKEILNKEEIFRIISSEIPIG